MLNTGPEGVIRGLRLNWISRGQPLSDEEDHAILPVAILNALCGQYKTHDQRCRHYDKALAEESPRKDGTIGAALLQVTALLTKQLAGNKQLRDLLFLTTDPELALDPTPGRHGLPEFIPKDDAALLNSLLLKQIHSGIYGEPSECIQIVAESINALGAICVDSITKQNFREPARLFNAVFLVANGVHSSLGALQSGRKINEQGAVDLHAILTGHITYAVHAYIVQALLDKKLLNLKRYGQHLKNISERQVSPHKIDDPIENKPMLRLLQYLHMSADRFWLDTLSHPTEVAIEQALTLLKQIKLTKLPFRLKDTPRVLPEGRVRMIIRLPDSPPLFLLLSGPEHQICVGSASASLEWPKGYKILLDPFNDTKLLGDSLLFSEAPSSGKWGAVNPRISLVATPLLDTKVGNEDTAVLSQLSDFAWKFVMGLWTNLPTLFDAAVNLPFELWLEAFPAQVTHNTGTWNIKYLGSRDQLDAISKYIPNDWNWIVEDPDKEEPKASTTELARNTAATISLHKALEFEGIKAREVFRILTRLGVSIQSSKGTHLKLTLGERSCIASQSIYDTTKPMPFWAIRDALRSLGIAQDEFIAQLDK